MRDRILIGVLGFLALMQGLVFLMERGGANRPEAVLDMGIGLMGAVGTLVAIFMATNLVYKEMDRRTIYVVLAKPVSRFQFLAGKYLGLMATLTLMLALMAGSLGLLMGLLGLYNGEVFGLCLAFWVELAMVTALAFCFSTITSGVLSAIYTVCLYVVGQQATLIREFADTEVGLARYFLASKFNYYGGNALYYVLPHFEAFDFKNQVLYGIGMPWDAWAWSLLYGALMSAMLLLVATLAWESRELI